MKNKFILIFCLLCTVGLAGFADDYSFQCRDDSWMACRDQSSSPVTYNNQDFIQNQQNQLSQRGYQPSAPQAYQPTYSYLNFPQQNMQAPAPAYNSYASDMNNFEQQRVAVDTVNQMSFTSVAGEPPGISHGVPTDDPMELSRKIKEAAQNFGQDPAQNSTKGYAQDATQGY